METLIFVDVDGVLNVKIGDPGHAPLSLNSLNVERAEAAWAERYSCQPREQQCIERVVATCAREIGNGEAGTYKKLTSSPATGLSGLLVGRLAQIIRAAGKGAQVVLSSRWRLPKYARRVKVLENAIGCHLGKPFMFHARTPLCEDQSAAARLLCIGEFAAAHCRKRDGSSARLRMVILDDFHMTALGTWSMNGHRMDSAKDVEEYLLSCIPQSAAAGAKLIHTFDEWMEPGGLAVRIATGLTEDDVGQALSFLGCPRRSPPPAPLVPLGSLLSGPGLKSRSAPRGKSSPRQRSFLPSFGLFSRRRAAVTPCEAC